MTCAFAQIAMSNRTQKRPDLKLALRLSFLCLVPSASALDPSTAITQYHQDVWRGREKHKLPASSRLVTEWLLLDPIEPRAGGRRGRLRICLAWCCLPIG